MISRIESAKSYLQYYAKKQSMIYKTPHRIDEKWLGSSLKKPEVYGGILVVKEEAEIYYAIVQGRYTEKWSFPKGHVNKGEEPLQCALREIEEETGIQGLKPIAPHCKIGYGNYFVFSLTTRVELKPNDTMEIMDTRWVTKEQMETMRINSDIQQFIGGAVSLWPA